MLQYDCVTLVGASESSDEGVQMIVVSARIIYWSDTDRQEILKLNLNGTAPSITIQTGVLAYIFALSPDYLYYRDAEDT